MTQIGRRNQDGQTEVYLVRFVADDGDLVTTFVIAQATDEADARRQARHKITVVEEWLDTDLVDDSNFEVTQGYIIWPGEEREDGNV
jgi:hypothetical protein